MKIHQVLYSRSSLAIHIGPQPSGLPEAKVQFYWPLPNNQMHQRYSLPFGATPIDSNEPSEFPCGVS